MTDAQTSQDCNCAAQVLDTTQRDSSSSGSIIIINGSDRPRDEEVSLGFEKPGQELPVVRPLAVTKLPALTILLRISFPYTRPYRYMMIDDQNGGIGKA